MWFKQAAIFQLKEDLSYSSDKLKEKLSALAYKPCLPSMPNSMGWVAPIDVPEAPLVQKINNYTMFCLQIEEKILPAKVVKQALAEKIKEIEHVENRKIRSKEKYELKDELVATFLPRAFSKLTRIYAYIDPKHNYLIVNTIQKKKLEKIVSMFTKTLGTELTAIEITKLSYILTQWLKNQNYASMFGIEKACTLQDPDQQNRVVRCQQQDLFVNSIQSFLKEGFHVKQLALSWHDRVNFVLNNSFLLSGIKFQDEIVSQTKEMEAETLQQQFIADFLIMSATITTLLADLSDALKTSHAEQVVTLARTAS